MSYPLSNQEDLKLNFIRKTVKILFLNLLILFAILEAIAQILPVQDATNVPAVNSANPIIHFKPNQEILNSFGPLLEGYNLKSVNNYGYFSDFDYQKMSKPKIMLIGDSYVEAMQVPNSSSVTGVLEEMTGNTKTVYSIGFSGSPLSQYLSFAKFSKDEFDPFFFVFLIIGNDFDESLLEYKRSPGFFYYNKEDDLQLVDYTPSPLKSVARNSAFLRYLFLNFHVQKYLNNITSVNQSQIYYSNTVAVASPNRLERSKHAVDLFLSDVIDLLGEDNVLFVLDADRNGIYQQESPYRNPKYYSNIMFNYFKEKSEQKGLRTLDLQTTFFDEYQLNKQVFEAPYDAHWNERGHRIAAEAIYQSLFQRE